MRESPIPAFGCSLLAQSPVAIPEGADAGAIVRLAADLKPSARQLAWQATSTPEWLQLPTGAAW